LAPVRALNKFYLDIEAFLICEIFVGELQSGVVRGGIRTSNGFDVMGLTRKETFLFEHVEDGRNGDVAGVQD